MLHGLIEKQATVPTAVKQWRNLVSMHADGGVVSHATAPANVASIVSSGRILPSAAPGRTQHGPGAYFLNSPEPAWSHGRAALAVSGSSGAARGLEAVRDGVMRTAGGAFPLARRDTFIAGGHNPVVRSAQDVAQRAGMRVVAPEVARSFAERVTRGAGLGLDNEAKRRLVRALRGKEAAAPVVSKEKHRALQRVDAHFAAERPNWDAFVQHAKRKSFVKALAADPRADATLRRHVEQMHQLHAGKRVKTVTGVSGKYQVVKKPQGGLACTCPDWRYRRSVMFGADQKCKHIHAYEASQEKSAGLTAAGAALGGVVGAVREYTKQRPERDAYRVHGDLGHVAPDVLEARARGRLGRVMLAGAGGAALGGLAGHGLQQVVPAAQGAARAAAHDIGHHLGRGVVEGARADLGASPPSGWLWRKMLQGIAPAEKAAGVGDNIAAIRTLNAVTSPKTVVKSISKTMGRLGTLTQKAPSGAVPPSGGA